MPSKPTACASGDSNRSGTKKERGLSLLSLKSLFFFTETDRTRSSIPHQSVSSNIRPPRYRPAVSALRIFLQQVHNESSHLLLTVHFINRSLRICRFLPVSPIHPDRFPPSSGGTGNIVLKGIPDIPRTLQSEGEPPRDKIKDLPVRFLTAHISRYYDPLRWKIIREMKCTDLLPLRLCFAIRDDTSHHPRLHQCQKKLPDGFT